jgi:hypothetical protein
VDRSRAAGDKPPHSKEAGADRSRVVGEVHSKVAGADRSRAVGEVHSKAAGADHSKAVGEVHSKAAGVDRSRAVGEAHSKAAGVARSNSQEAGVDHSRVGHKEHRLLTSNKVDLLLKEPRPAHKEEPPTKHALA